MRRALPSLLVAPAILLVARPAGGGQVGIPTLDHSAPFLGHVLELSLGGGAPGQPVRLLESAAADQVVLAVGTLELDRSLLAVVASGTVAADGTARFELPLGSDPASAERELHLQALVGEPAAPAGAVLSEALHLRVLGPRAYVGCRGLAEPTASSRAGLWVASAIREDLVIDIDVGAPQPDGRASGDPNIVFTPDHSRGAWMASPFELILFDPFFGEIEARIPFQEASPTLLTDSSGTRLAVLETGYPDGPARLHVLDFESAAPLAVIDLPEKATGRWAGDGAGTAFVAGFDSAGRTQVRRVGLDDGVVQGAYPVGSARSNSFTALAVAAGQLFVGTEDALWADTGPNGEFSRLALEGAHLEVVVSTFEYAHGPSRFTAVPGAGILLFPMSLTFPMQLLESTRLAGPSKVVQIDTPTSYIGVRDMVARDAGVWALAPHMDFDGPEQLYRMENAARGVWTHVGPLPQDGSQDIDSLRDAFADRIVYTLDRADSPISAKPALLVLHDPVSHAEVELVVGARPRALRVVPVP